MASVKLVRRFCSAALGVLAAAFAVTAGHAAPTAPADIATATSDHRFVSAAPLAQLFSVVCLKAFPDRTAVDQALEARSQAPLSAEQAKAYLPDGPGQGWLVRTPESLFAVTLEDPPRPTCAVQQMTPDGVRDIEDLMQAIKAHVTAIKGKLVAVAPETATTPDGSDIRYFGYGVLGPDGSPVEQFGVYISDYHGKVVEPWTAFSGKGSGVEVRFTRTILAG